MPDWNPSDTRSNRLISIGIVGSAGEKERFRLNELGIEPYSSGELNALRSAIADATTMGMFQVVETLTTEISIQNAQVYDELHDSTRALQCVLENSSANLISAYVAGTKSTLFASDGVTLLAGDSGASIGTPQRIVYELKTAVENVVNNSFSPAESYVFIRGILRPNKVPLRDSPVLPQVVEP